MPLTDLFIKRPVLATVISLLILVLGLRSVGILPILQYPYTEYAMATVTTAYVGADPDIIAGFITTPLETSIAQANGIDYMTSSSTPGTSTINVNLMLNYDPIRALADITSKVNAVINQLPTASQLPVTAVTVSQTIDSMYIGFYSDQMPINKITDYIIRAVQPRLQAINGVQQAQIIGNQTFALRSWMDPLRLAGFNISPYDVTNKLNNNDFIAAAGRTDGSMFIQNLTVDTNLTDPEQFKSMILKQSDGGFVRLKDVSKVTLGAQNYNQVVSFNDMTSVYVGIVVAPSANLLTVINDIKAMMPDIVKQLPSGLDAKIVYDASAYVNSAINEVVKSLFEAFMIVSIVILLFLGSIRSVTIPLIAIPLSIVGTFFVMLFLGYSINLLTLLALVLAIGLVVDDAIIVVENVERHIANGRKPTTAAIFAARELANPIIAITVVLFAVYAPIGFMGGLTGALFTEFAFTLVGAVTISAVIALTLSPMMCSKFLKAQEHGKSFVVDYIDKTFLKLQNGYEKILKSSLDSLPVTAVFAIIILSSNYFLFVLSKTELAPQEDQGIIIAQATAPANASLAQTALYDSEIAEIFRSYKQTNMTFQIDGSNGLNVGIVGMNLIPWDERTVTTNQLQPEIQQKINKIAGAKVAAFQLPSLPGGGSGLPIQFVIKTTNDFYKLNEVLQTILDKAYATGLFAYIDPDLKIDQVQTKIHIDRDKASEMGLDMKSVGDVISSSLSENYVNYFGYYGRSYQVIPEMTRNTRSNTEQLLSYYITTENGNQVPLATFATLERMIVPESINHFQQANSTTISAIAFPGVTMGQALGAFQEIAQQVLPQGYLVDYASQSRQFVQEGNALIVAFFFALVIIFLSLAALFESFRDPLIVLISVPMSICGAMIFVCLGIGGASLNIYSEVGLVTLIGLISKHGILIVQFANDLQREGKKKREAVEMAAGIRLRPILMTTFAMVLGVIPLIRATGAGALSRYNIGLVVATGISIGTLFTLFVVPAMYMFLAENHALKEIGEEVDHEIEK